jgi:hypothetical protein
MTPRFTWFGYNEPTSTSGDDPENLQQREKKKKKKKLNAPKPRYT